MFSEACGACGPLALEWSGDHAGGSGAREFEGPSVVVGRSLECGLTIDDPRVGQRHAYLQVIEGRVFAMDLGSREGLRWGTIPRLAGWVDPVRPVSVGPAQVRVVSGHDPRAPLGAGPGPTSERYQPRTALPRVALELEGHEGPATRLTLDRPLTLVGTSEVCQIRLKGPRASRFVCGLVLTPSGLWVTDLLSTRGVSINGARCREARLEDGDRLGFGEGEASFKTVYNADSVAPPSATPGRFIQTLQAHRFPSPAESTAPLVPELLRPLFEEGGALSGGGDPSGDAVLLLIRLLGDVHRDHQRLVREELEQIQRLSQEMANIKGLISPQLTGRSSPTAASPPNVAGLPGPEPRPDPAEIHVLVSDRLAAWQREREGRWSKVISLLMGS